MEESQDSPDLRIAALSERQREILRLVAQHLQAKEVARVLQISERTVRSHTDQARRRLGVSSSREAARLLAMHEGRWGIVHDGQWLPTPIADGGQAAPGSSCSEVTRHDQSGVLGELGGGGAGLESAGGAHQSVNGAGGGQSREASMRRTVAEQDDVGDPVPVGLAGGRRAQLRRSGWHELTHAQWFLLIVGVAGASAVITGGLVTTANWGMEALQALHRHQLH
jgi:DNA-binding CsgD family transcriptional regulator